MSRPIFPASLIAAALLLAGCAGTPQSRSAPIAPARIAAHVNELASDAYEGRAPGTEGETKTVAYIEAAYRDAGLVPISGDDYRVPVPLVKSEVEAGSISVGDVTVAGGDGAVMRPPMGEQSQSVAAEIVFAGYGISAAEHGRDDFAGLDLRGRIALVFAGLPAGDALPEPVRVQATRTTKIANALRAGAAGLIIVYDVGADDESWRAARGFVGREVIRIDGQAPDMNEMLLAVVGREDAQRLTAGLGTDLAALRGEAAAAGFKARALGAGRMEARNRLTRFSSDNVAGVLRGRKRPDEYVVYLAHWDHLGHCGKDADTICNGAVDNASGVGGLIELASTFAHGRRPARSVLFLATTAEESGLLGGRHFAASGPIPAKAMVAAFGLDTIAANGPTKDVIVLGQGLSTLDDWVADAARAQGRQIAPMPDVQSFYARSDHFGFAEAGVPAVIATGVFASGGSFGDYMAKHYHKPSDAPSLPIDYSGAAADMDLLLAAGSALASSTNWPTWSKSSPHQRQP